MSLTDKQKEDIATRKAINEAKRAKKGARKPSKKVEQAVQDNPELTTEFVEEALKATEEINDGEVTPYVSPSESITDASEEQATNVPSEVENVSTASVDSLELIPNDVGSESVAEQEQQTPYNPENIKLVIGDNKEIEGFSEESVINVEIEPDCSIDFTNGRSKPAIYVNLGGYGTQEGTYFDKMMREIVYILTLGGKFDRQTAPRFSQLPLSVRMKVPVDKYSDYLNRVGYPDYESDGEYYRSSMSAPDFRVLLNFLEQRVSAGWELDPKQACMNRGRYVVPIRTRFPIENTAGLHTRVREPIKYTVEELRSMEWDNVKRIAALHGITDTNHNSVISQLKDIFEEKVDG